MISFRSLGALALVLALGWLFAGAAAAQEETAELIPVKVLVTHVSNEGEGGVDPSAKGLHDAFRRNQIQFKNIKVISKRRIQMELDEVYKIRLPGGRKAHIRPISRRGDSALMAVDVERSVKLDARVRRGKPFIIRAGRHNGGNLVIQLQLDD